MGAKWVQTFGGWLAERLLLRQLVAQSCGSEGKAKAKQQSWGFGFSTAHLLADLIQVPCSGKGQQRLGHWRMRNHNEGLGWKIRQSNATQ